MKLSISTVEPKAGSFLKQDFSLAIQVPNNNCVLSIFNDKTIIQENFSFLRQEFESAAKYKYLIDPYHHIM